MVEDDRPCTRGRGELPDFRRVEMLENEVIAESLRPRRCPVVSDLEIGHRFGKINRVAVRCFGNQDARAFRDLAD